MPHTFHAVQRSRGQRWWITQRHLRRHCRHFLVRRRNFCSELEVKLEVEPELEPELER